MADDKNEGLDEASDAKASVGDIFGVSSGKKKKKKKKKKPEAEAKPEPKEEAELGDDDSVPFPDDEPADEAKADAASEPADEPEAEDEEEAAAKSESKPKKKKKKNEALDGVLLPSSNDDLEMDADDYLSPSDLGDYDGPKNKSVPYLWGIIAVLVLVILGGGVHLMGWSDDLIALFKGELREKRIAEARMEEEKFREEQLAKLDRFGNLMISGNPQYALVKLNGQIQYGKTSAGWREVRVGTSAGVQDLKIKQAHQVEFTAPGFEPYSVEITEGKWQETPGAGFSYAITPSMLPESVHAKQEFDARMSEDVENEYFGKITLNTTPAGAKVIFNNQPLLDENGEELVTPVTFDKYYVKDEESGKLEEKEVKVDTALDVGHKIQLAMEYENQCPEAAEGTPPPQCGKVDNCCPAECSVATDTDCKWPAYVTSLTRPMWTCTWNTDDGQPPADIAKDKTIQHYCDYAFTMDLDFNNLKSYIVAREEERQRIMEQYKSMQQDADAGEAAEGAETAQAE